jgi:hypothetical protein
MKRDRAKGGDINAKAESRRVDFKREFDSDCAGDWCELIKDLVAIANSGGGSILIGVDDNGKCCGPAASAKLLRLDPAKITDKVAKYTGAQFDSFTITAGTRKRGKVGVITIGCADPPLIFEKPGTYALEDGKQKTAFGVGTLYVRHGAKSEPAGHDDVIRLVERSVHRARKEWLTGVRKVSMAPRGSRISVLPPHVIQSSDPNATPIRITVDPKAPEYQLVDPDKTYPWRQKELIEELNKALPTKINSFDLLALRRFYKIDTDAKFVYKHRFGSQQYSPAFAKWILEQYSQDPRLFLKCRAASGSASSTYPGNDPQLSWLSSFMQKNGLSCSRMAKKLKISDATLNRLLAGKYDGNVKRMVERIAAFRKEQEAKTI